MAFALAGLVMGLTRPEGVFLAGLMVATLLLYKPQCMRPVLVAHVAVFASLGLGYLVWRRWYFGTSCGPHSPRRRRRSSLRWSQGCRAQCLENGLAVLVGVPDWRAKLARPAGLNDPWIAQHGGVTAEYLAAWQPELIVFHAITSREDPPRFRRGPMFALGRPWGDMVVTMHEYALAHSYILAASFPDPGWGSTYYFYVRPHVPESAELITRLRNLRRTRFG